MNLIRTTTTVMSFAWVYIVTTGIVDYFISVLDMLMLYSYLHILRQIAYVYDYKKINCLSMLICS